MKTVCWIILTLNSCLNADFTRTNSGIVTDNITSLQWQDNYNDNKHLIKQTHWSEAIDYCEGLILEGKDDWRVPNIKELQSIIDNEEILFSINSIFKLNKAGFYWSSTTYQKDSLSHVWQVNFSNGSTIKGTKRDKISFVRCVRTEE